jgi:hypothetical protein
MVSNRAAEELHSYQLTCCDLKQKQWHRTKRWTPSGGPRAFEMENLVGRRSVNLDVLAHSTRMYSQAPGGLVLPEPTLRSLTTISRLLTTPAASCGR